MAGTTNKEVAVWTMRLHPDGKEDAFEFCKREKLIGIGWSLDGDVKIGCVECYRRTQQEQEKYTGDVALTKALNMFEEISKAGKLRLVWVKSPEPENEYYLCEVTGGYEYCHSGKYAESGIVNFVGCRFYPVEIDEVPGRVIETYSLRGTIHSVKDEAAVLKSRQLWEKGKS